jgi:hypothetical protein
MHGTLPLSDEKALESLRDANLADVNLAALAREWGWSRGKVRHRIERWRRNGDLPPAAKRRAIRRTRPTVAAAPAAAADPAPGPAPDPLQHPVAAAPDPAPTPVALPVPASAVRPPTRHSRVGAVLGTAILASVGMALALIGMIETTTYSLRVGGPIFAALAICADALVLFMPAAVAALWRRRSPAMMAAAALWLVGAAVTVANLSGYVASSDDEFRALRQSRSMQRTLAMERLDRLRTERASISEMRPVGALNAALRNARRSRQPALREALAVAERRDGVEVELSALAAGLPDIPQTAVVDPSASVLSDISGTTVSEESLRRARLTFLLALPLCGGFVLSIALSLLAAPRTRGDAPA